MRILMIGDIVGAPGRRAVRELLPRLREAWRPDAVIANAENAAGGQGLTPPLAEELLRAGLDAITLGDHVWDQKALEPWLDREPRVVRPANLPPACPGRGLTTLSTPAGPLTIISLLGRVFMTPIADCPFRVADQLLRSLPPNAGPVLVDIHAEATSEKAALGWHLDGRVALVAGTHTHVQTADERLLPGGTAFISDLGMTGPADSIIGRDIASVLEKFLTGMPRRFKIARGRTRLDGVVVEIAPTGRAEQIRRVQEWLDVPAEPE
ncbi:MAG: TIGR00282 family metallophosphoesterase [Kiritimatiellae bacterium]|nr:TIGR00282 family metallophosphoesterase [Kiritimatiellia bacterium]